MRGEGGGGDRSGSTAIGATGVLVSMGRVSTGRTSLPCAGAKAPTSAKARMRTGGGEEGARGSAWHQCGAEDLTNLLTDKGQELLTTSRRKANITLLRRAEGYKRGARF